MKQHSTDKYDPERSQEYICFFELNPKHNKLIYSILKSFQLKYFNSFTFLISGVYAVKPIERVAV